VHVPESLPAGENDDVATYLSSYVIQAGSRSLTSVEDTTTFGIVLSEHDNNNHEDSYVIELSQYISFPLL
jgi:hypothetical protein